MTRQNLDSTSPNTARPREACMRLEGKVAIVTGGAQNLGYTYVEQFLREGAHVALADINEEAGKQAAADLEKLGDVRFFPVDVSSEESATALAAAVESAWGPADILVNN